MITSAFEAERFERGLRNDRGVRVRRVVFTWLCACAHMDVRERPRGMANGRAQPGICVHTAGELGIILTFLKGGEKDKIS